MFYYEIPWFYQDFKSENLCFLYLYSVHAVRILDLSLLDHVKSFKMKNETPLQLYRLSLHAGIIFLLLEAKFINVFKIC